MNIILPTPVLPPPSALGMPGEFNSWYPYQDQAVSWCLDRMAERVDGHPSSRRFLAVSAPTGSGKSILAALVGHLTGSRTVILTATKGLQDQYRDTIGECLGAMDIRGQNAYICTLDGEMSVDDAPCHAGFACPMRGDLSCPYFAALNAVRNPATRLIITNYACWMALCEHSGGLGKVDLLVLDEAHRAYDQLSSYLTIDIAESETLRYGIEHPTSVRVEDWMQWGVICLPILEDAADLAKAEMKARHSVDIPVRAAEVRNLRRLAGLISRVRTIAELKGNWVIEIGNKRATLAPLWPAEYAESRLLLGVPKVMLMSATLTPKALELLGVKANEYSLHDVPSAFPVANRQVTYIPTARMNHRASEEDLRLWVIRVDQIIDGRMDRKGIVHTVSYKRRDLLFRYSRHRDILYSHGSRDVSSAIYRFRRAHPPAVIVSPSLSEGFDFPYSDCEYIIVGKVPYPDTRSPLTKARMELDPEWPSYQAMQALVQASGRGVRTPTDRCEIFIIDDDWQWFWGRYQRFAPRWFREAVKFVRTIPSPPVAITR